MDCGYSRTPGADDGPGALNLNAWEDGDGQELREGSQEQREDNEFAFGLNDFELLRGRFGKWNLSLNSRVGIRVGDWAGGNGCSWESGRALQEEWDKEQQRGRSPELSQRARGGPGTL